MATPAQSIQPVHTLGGEQNGRVERAGGAGGWSGAERSRAERSGAERSGAERPPYTGIMSPRIRALTTHTVTITGTHSISPPYNHS